MGSLKNLKRYIQENELSVEGTRIFFICMVVIGVLFVPDSEADDISPTAHNINVSVTMDKASLPPSVILFNDIFGGKTSNAGDGNASQIYQNRYNTLTCLSRTDTTRGACPVNPYWGNGRTAPVFRDNLVLRFTQQGTGKTADLTLSGIRKRPSYGDTSLWNAVGNDSGLPITMSLSIPKSELAKLSADSIPWKARLVMNLTRWTNNCSDLTSATGCPGSAIFAWTADITLKITDYGTQQIYFYEYGSSEPVVDLDLRQNKFGSSSATASASRTLDMCLYDGSNSSSNQIRILFSDEGKSAPERNAGEFSIYSENGTTDLANRIDYRISIINPMSGESQSVMNGMDIVWTGLGADKGTVKTRLVKLPGVSGMVKCVPSPLTIKVPEFKVSSKMKGRYKGILRVIYTPTTQSWKDNIPQ